MSSSAPRWGVWLALGIVYVVWGSTYLAIRLTVDDLPSLLSGGARFLLAGVLLALWLVARRGPRALALAPRELGASALLGALLLTGGVGMVMVVERHIPSSLAAIIASAVALWVVLMRRLSGERVARGTLGGVCVGFLGVAALVLPGDRPEDASVFWILVMVCASLSWAVGSFYSGRLPVPADPLVATAAEMIWGGAFLAVLGFVTGENLPASVPLGSTLALLYLALAGSLVAFTAYVWLLRHAPISKVVTHQYVNPVVAILLGWLVLSEEITPVTWLAAGAIVASVAFIVRKETPRAEPAQEAADGVVAEPEAEPLR